MNIEIHMSSDGWEMANLTCERNTWETYGTRDGSANLRLIQTINQTFLPNQNFLHNQTFLPN